MADNTQFTINIQEAARRLGISRNAAYDAAARGDIPTIRIGKLLRVPVRALDRMLGIDSSAAPKVKVKVECSECNGAGWIEKEE